MLAATPKQLSTDKLLFCFFFSFFVLFFFFLFFNFLLFSTLSVLYHPLLNSHGKSERSENRKLFVSFLFFAASC